MWLACCECWAQEKDGLLEFWLRMGFDELGEEMVGSPIEGVAALPLPPSLAAAASGITDAGTDIRSLYMLSPVSDT